MVLVAAGCGGDDDASSESSATTEASASTPETSSEDPASDDPAPEPEPAADPTVVVGELAGATLTAGALQDFAGAIRTTESDALGTWLMAIAIEGELNERGRPLTDTDLDESAAFLAATTPNPGSDLVRANAVFTVARTFGEEQVAPLVTDADPPEVLCSSHILLATEAEAADVAAQAQAGEDFAELAMTFSTGPSGPLGGDLGCTTTSTFVPEFGDGARANGVGITDPVESQFGWHVIQVRSIGPGTIDIHPALTEEEIASIQQGLLDEVLGTYLGDLLEAASAQVADAAEFDPAYGTWDQDLAALVG